MMPTKQKNTLRVLIADDDKDDRYFIDLAFKEAELPHIVNFVSNGEELMEYLYKIHASGNTQETPDLVLLDLNMPKKDGREALKEIKSDFRFQSLNVVIFSTTISEQDRVFTSMLGASGHIIKPFDFSELIRTIREVCDSCLIAA
jgi:CheY-like chemotaxis protein